MLTNCNSSQLILKSRPMFVLRNLASFKQLLKPTNPFVRGLGSKLAFCTNKRTLDEQLQMFADSLKETKNGQTDFSELANNYIQLEENSFSDYAKEHQNDPSMMLMFLSTFEDPTQIAEYLPMLYPKIDFLEKSQLLLLMEKVLAFKPKSVPKVPFPKPLEGIQSILVIMSEIYPANTLIEWLKLIPLYTGTEHYILFMGYFSILEKISPEVKVRNQSLWIKCHEKICSVMSDESEALQVRVGVIILAFQLSYGQAGPLLLITNIDYQHLDPFKNCLLFINVSKYLIRRKRTEGGEKQGDKLQKMLKKSVNEMAEALTKLQFAEFMKIEIFVQLWFIIKELKQVQGVFLAQLDKLLKLTTDKKFLRSLSELSTNELLFILEAMQKHKVNNEKALKLLLILFAPHLRNMARVELMRLLKCLVTYVRQSEDYLINTRQILEQRKLQFSDTQTLKINQILQRVEVLFPTRFANK